MKQSYEKNGDSAYDVTKRHADVIDDVEKYGIPTNNLLFNCIGAEVSGAFIDVNAEVLRKFVQKDLAAFGVDVKESDITFERDHDGKNSFKILIWFSRNSKYITYTETDKDSIYGGKTNYRKSAELARVVNTYVENPNQKNFYNASNGSKKVALALDEQLFLATAFDTDNEAFKKCIHYEDIKNNDDAPTVYEKIVTIHSKWTKNNGHDELVSIRIVITKADDKSEEKLEPGKAIKI